MAPFQASFDLLLLSGDVEANPGPRGRPAEKPDPVKVMESKLEDQEKKIEELNEVIKGQDEVIKDLQNKQVVAEERIEKLQVEFTDRIKESKENHELSVTELKDEIKKLTMGLSGIDNLGESSVAVNDKVEQLNKVVEDIQEKLHEIDKSSQNNLVFYGIKCDSGSDETTAVIEAKIREVLVHNMHITRDMPFVRIRRSWNGPDIRGSKPITVTFEKWQDKELVLRKGKLLRGSHIFVDEDFSKKVKEHRTELMRYMREIKRRNPKVKCRLKYDKLFINKDIYVFNEMTCLVEQLQSKEVEQIYDKLLFSSSPSTPRASSISPTRRRRTKSSHATLKKSHSTESSLHTLAPNSPVHMNENEDGNAQTNGAAAEEGEYNGGSTSMAEDESDSECISRSSDNESSRNESPRRKSNPNIPETIPE